MLNPLNSYETIINKDSRDVNSESTTVAKTYKGKYKVKNPDKYAGNADDVVYRSGWERACFLWCDRNADVVKWVSEETVIPYLDKAQISKSYPMGKPRRYFMDLTIQFKSGEILMVEVKPSSQTQIPKKGKRQTKKYLAEVATYATNCSKWEAAAAYAKKKGWKFIIWDEKILKKMRILKW